uniref:CUE domain-containing protein n=1 Tax=Onchocerca volvulus TaxID=6282 RepID=A0A8R1Y077_ONCVO
MTTLLLQRLEVDTDIDNWINNWRYAVESLNDILTLSESALRNRLSDDRQILELIDSFLDIFPKDWQKNEALSMALNGSLQSDRREEIRAIIVEMYTKILMLFMKLSREFVGKHIYQKNILFDLNRLFRAIVIFKTSNQDAIENIITAAFDTKQFTEKDVEEFTETMEQEFIDYSNSIAFSENNINKMETFLEKCLINFEGLTTLASLLSNHHISQMISFKFLNSVACFVEHLEEHYCMEQMMNMSADLQEIFRILLTLVDSMIASAYAFFHAVIVSFTSVDEVYTIIVNCLQYERFIFYYSIIYPIEEVLHRCDENQKTYINDTLEHIRWNCITNILEQLKKRGLLVDLGSSANQEVKEKIGYLAELLPHFSPQFIHLCLRHFGYETEQTVNALLNTNELPLDLQALMSVELKEENAPMIVAESSPFYDFTGIFFLNFILNDEISDAKAKTNETKSSDPLICMKPPQLSANKQEMESINTAQNVSGSKTMNNARKDLKAKFDVEVFLKGRKMDVQIKDKPSFTETFDVPNSEKVALRPTYERYRYVEATSEYDLYNDEYDDTYDIQHQNYGLDLSDDDITFMEDGIEPNTNHIPVNDEVNNDTENEKEKEIREVNARRKKNDRKNDRKMMNAIVPDGKNRNNASSVQEFRKKAEKVESSSGNNSNERHKPGYTGGRDRQLKERHKGEFRRRQADKKMRGGMF